MEDRAQQAAEEICRDAFEVGDSPREEWGPALGNDFDGTVAQYTEIIRKHFPESRPIHKVPEQEGGKATPHPYYGPCDGIANGQCAECLRIGEAKPEAPAPPPLKPFPLECDRCQFQTQDFGELERHNKTHEAPAPQPETKEWATAAAKEIRDILTCSPTTNPKRAWLYSVRVLPRIAAIIERHAALERESQPSRPIEEAFRAFVRSRGFSLDGEWTVDFWVEQAAAFYRYAKGQVER